MSTIPNFPAALLEEHMHWHHANHHDDPSNLPPGYGEKFLRFHRDYITRALQWYQQAGLDPRLVAPWQEVPEPIRRSGCYDIGAEMRIRNAPQSFASIDELGRFIEGTNLHGCMHQEAARLYREEDLNDFDVAPRSTVFYNIHGMIDNWYRQWERAMGYRTQASGSTGAARSSSTVSGTVSRAGQRAKRKFRSKGNSVSRRSAGLSAADLTTIRKKHALRRKPKSKLGTAGKGVWLSNAPYAVKQAAQKARRGSAGLKKR